MPFSACMNIPMCTCKEKFDANGQTDRQTKCSMHFMVDQLCILLYY